MFCYSCYNNWVDADSEEGYLSDVITSLFQRWSLHEMFVRMMSVAQVVLSRWSPSPATRTNRYKIFHFAIMEQRYLKADKLPAQLGTIYRRVRRCQNLLLYL